MSNVILNGPMANQEVIISRDMGFLGFFPLSTAELMFEEYRQQALIMARSLDWDEVVLYALYCYDGDTQTIMSVDFMLLRMTYTSYLKLYSKLSRDCRLFFVRNR